MRLIMRTVAGSALMGDYKLLSKARPGSNGPDSREPGSMRLSPDSRLRLNFLSPSVACGQLRTPSNDGSPVRAEQEPVLLKYAGGKNVRGDSVARWSGEDYCAFPQAIANSKVKGSCIVMAEAVGQKLWEHPEPASTRTFEFKTLIERKHDVQLHTYQDLQKWSINHLENFWEEVWHYTGIKASTPFSKVGSTFNLQSPLILLSGLLLRNFFLFYSDAQQFLCYLPRGIASFGQDRVNIKPAACC